MKFKRIIASILATVLILSSSVVNIFAEESTAATRGEVVQMLLIAADDYNPTVQKTDVIKGYEDGQLHEERYVTRAEALIMLKRAFGELPEPTGHNERVAFQSDDFTDIPQWAEGELQDVFDAGIVAGTAQGIFSPDELVTHEQMDLFIDRVFALYGSNLKDDFYASVNKERLNAFELPSGMTIAGGLNDLNSTPAQYVNEMFNTIFSGEWEEGSIEQKFAKLLGSMLSMEETGVTPVEKYFDMIDEAQNIEELTVVNNTLYKELCIAPFFGFSIDYNLKDNANYMVTFDTASAELQKNFYFEDTDKKDIYLTYLKSLLVLGGETEENAEIKANQFFETEKCIAENSLDAEKKNDLELLYNVFTFDEIKGMFPQVDIELVFEITSLKKSDEICIFEVDKVKAFSEYYNNENIDSLKNYAKMHILLKLGSTLNQAIYVETYKYKLQGLDIEKSMDEEYTLDNMMMYSIMGYLGEKYAEQYLPEGAIKDIEKMVADIKSAYRKKLEDNDWLSETTKAKAIEKLDAMGAKIGYDANWHDTLEDVEILGVEEGGTVFGNIIAIRKAKQAKLVELQSAGVDKSEWPIPSFFANAYYNALSNEIIVPAGILQAPVYDVNASYEQNLGGIGYVIAHEITHAFDNNGAKFDAQGNMDDWWTEEDYAIFEEKCNEMIEFYDGKEAVPGVPTNGTLTLGENIADNGALSCITEIVSGLENPDYKALYISLAKVWATTATRDLYIQLSQTDTHSADKLRVNRCVVNCDEFYEAFDVTESDGMYIAPEDRVKIW